MFVKITYSKNIRETLRYHEKKIEHNEARLLYADNFLKEAAELSREDKIYHFERLISLNDRITRPVIHLSYNFHPLLQLTDGQMQQVSREFMQDWGRADQPYLVYRHLDRPHPHVHFVSTIIQPNGDPRGISPHEWHQANDLGKRLQQELAESLSITIPHWRNEPDAPAERIQYGQQPVYRAMNTILKEVIPEYRYTSLDELNALLRLYSIRTYRGRPDSALHAHDGLIYQVLGENGRPVGSAIKASDFESQPTLKNLRQRFEQNESLRDPDRRRLTVTIDWAFRGDRISMAAFRGQLEEEQISTVLKSSRDGVPRDIWYIDHLTKTVFEGRALGAGYSAEEIAKRCVSNEVYQSQRVQRQTEDQQLKQRIRGLQ